jgi:hypothetical protein
MEIYKPLLALRNGFINDGYVNWAEWGGLRLGHVHPDLHESPWRLQRMETAHHAVQEEI